MELNAYSNEATNVGTSIVVSRDCAFADSMMIYYRYFVVLEYL